MTDFSNHKSKGQNYAEGLKKLNFISFHFLPINNVLFIFVAEWFMLTVWYLM